ncbi:MAG: DUF2243 domain-containing protein [Acidimicrobiia bacterium]
MAVTDEGSSVPSSGIAWDGIAGLLVGAGLGGLAYRIVLDRLLDADRVVIEDTMTLDGLRGAALDVGSWVLLVVGLVLVVRIWRTPSLVTEWSTWLGAGLLGLGGAFFAWSVLDMHGLGRYDWSGSGSEIVADLLYHGLPALVAAVGYGLLAGAPRRSDPG